MRTLILLAAATVVSFGAHAGQWRYDDNTVDKMSGKTAHYAVLVSDNSLNLDRPYQGENRGQITVRKHPQYGTDVLIGIDKGQILCRSYDPCLVTIKFDNGKPAQFSAVSPADHSSETVFLENSKRFIAQARKATRILVQFDVYRGGRPVLEFSTPVELVWTPKN